MAPEQTKPTTGPPAPPTTVDLFRMMKTFNATDLHLKPGSPPLFRVRGTIQPLKSRPLSAEQVDELIEQILNDQQHQTLKETGDADFSYTFEEDGRVRVNVFIDRGRRNLAARLVWPHIEGFNPLHLPPILGEIALRREGLILVCGPTGSGKSTTLAAMVDHINHNRRCHIITIEDPIEFLFRDDKAFIHQREVGTDTPSWVSAMKHVVRQDPDVIVIGELRDIETVRTALHAAETGHLVFGTLHGADVEQSLARLIDMFPAPERESARNALSLNILAALAMKLVNSCLEDTDLVPAVEIMIANQVVRRLIRDAEENKIHDAIRAASKEGMQDFTQALAELVRKEWVTTRDAIAVAPNEDELRMELRGVHLTHKGFVG